jgi:hypothetical protein
VVVALLRLLATLTALTCVAQLLLCTIGLPLLAYHARRPSTLGRRLGIALHTAAYLCALARLPFTPGPWLVKRAFFLLLPHRAALRWQQPGIQLLRLAGEGANLLIVALLLQHTLPFDRRATVVVALVAGAEGLRLAAQKGQMLASASWQALPHRTTARFVGEVVPRLAGSAYCRYYGRDDGVRLRYLRATIRRLARPHPLAVRRLASFNGFRIVPDSHYLRSGDVRDIACGDVFVHHRWTNDPWLLIGLALRRAPWIFDPRELPRPFGYRTTANRVMTAFVLCHARFSPPFAWYQFGHEIKAASHDLVLRALGLLGVVCEAPLRADGTFPFEYDAAGHREGQLWTDDTALRDIRRRLAAGEAVSALEIAQRYAYPRCYVVDVLLPRLHGAPEAQDDSNAASIALAVAAGASQWG